MKFIAFLFLIFPLVGGVTDAETTSTSSEPMVNVAIELVDGTQIMQALPASELSSATAETFGVDVSEVLVCTAIGSNGNCKTTAATCAQAIAGTIACLKFANR